MIPHTTYTFNKYITAQHSSVLQVPSLNIFNNKTHNTNELYSHDHTADTTY